MKSVVLLNFVKNAAKCRNMREDIAADIPQFTRPKNDVSPHIFILYVGWNSRYDIDYELIYFLTEKKMSSLCDDFYYI